MADNIFTQANSKIWADLQETDQKYNQELKASQSSKVNPYDTHTRELFSTYFVSRHDQAGHYHTAQFDSLTPEQTQQFDNYVSRREFEAGMKEQGHSDDSIALMRQWDADIKEAMLNGTYDQLIASGKMLTREYADKAVTQYVWDEAMFDKYVASSRYIAQEIYKAGENGIFNITEDILDSMSSYTHDDLKEIYSWMDAEQKSQLGFDGIHTGQQFAYYTKSKAEQMIAAREANQDDGFTAFWKSLAHGFVTAFSETIALIPQLIGIVGGVVTFQGLDNDFTKSMFKAGESVVEGVAGGFDKAIHMEKVDHDSWAFKIGNFAGQAAEIAAELATGAVIAKGLSKATELGVKTAAKQVAKNVAKEGAKEGVKFSERVVIKGASKLVEKEAINIARKKGMKKITADIVEEAIKKVGARTEIAALSKTMGKEVINYLDHAAINATRRLAKRGMIKTSAEAIAKMDAGLAKTFLMEAAKVGGIKLIKEEGKQGIKAAVKEGAKGIGKKLTQEGVKKEGKRFSAEGAAAWLGKSRVLKNGVVGKTYKAVATSEGATLKLISQMAKKPGAISRSYRAVFGNGDMLSKLFATKAFTNTVIEGKKRGYSTAEALVRGITAAGTTNVIWGKLHMESRPNGLLGRLAPKEMGVTATEALGKVTNSFLYRNTAAIASTATKMIADGILQQEILEGIWGKDAQGENGQFAQAFKDNLNLTALAEKFVSALTMHATTAGIGKVNQAAMLGFGRANIVRESTARKTWEGIDRRMAEIPDKDKPWDKMWNYYRGQAEEKLIADGDKEPAQHKINDIAYEMARADGHFDITDAINEMYVKDSAYEFGEQVRLRHQQLQFEYNTDMRNLNELMYAEMGNGFEDTPQQREFFRLVLMNKVLKQDVQGIKSEEMQNQFKNVKLRTPAEVMIAYKFFIGLHGEKAEVNMEKMQEAFDHVDRLKSELGAIPWNQVMKWEHGHILWTVRALSDPNLKADAKKYNEFKSKVQELAEKHKGKVGSEEYTKELDLLMHKHNITDKFIANQEAAGNPDAQKMAPITQETKKKVDEKVVEKAQELDFKTVVKELVKKFILNGKGTPKEGFKEALTYIEELHTKGTDKGKLTTMEYAEIVRQLTNQFRHSQDWYDPKEFAKYEGIANAKTYVDGLVTGAFKGKGTPTKKGFKDYVEHNLNIIKAEIEYTANRTSGDAYEVPSHTREEYKKAYEEIRDLNTLFNSVNGQKGLETIFAGNGVNAQDVQKAVNQAEGNEKNRKTMFATQSVGDIEQGITRSPEKIAEEEEAIRMKNATEKAKTTLPEFEFSKGDTEENVLGTEDIIEPC